MANQRATIDYNRAIANREYLQNKYGGSANDWKNLEAGSLLGAEIQDSYAQWANSTIQANSVVARQDELNARSDKSISAIYAKSDQVKSVQTNAFIKSGVKLEGSALNVIQETASKAMDAAKVRQQETDFQNTQLEVQRRMMELKADQAGTDFIFGAANAYAGSQL